MSTHEADNRKGRPELVTLSLEDLDIEELDRRIELSPIATAAAWCQVNCGDLSNCVPNCEADCNLKATLGR